jgi:hypothetical protein
VNRQLWGGVKQLSSPQTKPPGAQVQDEKNCKNANANARKKSNQKNPTWSRNNPKRLDRKGRKAKAEKQS